jgi:hypothetical protein
VTEDSAFYDHALTRLSRVSVMLALTAVVVMTFLEGWRGALGAAGGALFSLGSLHRWKRVADALGSSSKTRLRIVVLLSYALLSASVFVIIRYFGVSAWSVVAGLFVSMAAVIVEIVYELLTNAK